jgi:hypothetical protein
MREIPDISLSHFSIWVVGASSDDLSEKVLGSFDALSASYSEGDFIGMLLSKTLLVVTQHSAWHPITVI